MEWFLPVENWLRMEEMPPGGFHLSENLEVLAEDPTLRMVSATIIGTVFEANIDRLQAGKTYTFVPLPRTRPGLRRRVETIRTTEHSPLPLRAFSWKMVGWSPIGLVLFRSTRACNGFPH